MQGRPGSDADRQLAAYFGGESEALVDALEALLLDAGDLSPFDRGWRERDLDLLRQFYVRGPCRNRVWAQRLGYPDGLVPKQRLDALILGEPT